VELGTQRQKMDELKQDIRVISHGFLQREGQLTSLYYTKAILENCKPSQIATDGCSETACTAAAGSR
jgi:centromeric protein E